MKDYIEFKIKKIHAIMIGIVLMIACGSCIFYVWCVYHPIINIKVSDGPTGKQNIKIEAPSIAMGSRYVPKIAASVNLNVQTLVTQHESICRYVGDTYKASNIKLELKEENNTTILTYHGTVVTMEDKVEKYENEIVLNFALHADIIN